MTLRRGLAASLLVAVTSACGGSSSTAPTAPSATATIASLTISGTASLTAVGQNGQLAAIATLSDGTSQDVTSSATWQSSNQAVVTVSSTGLATAIAAGQATITATTQAKSGTLAMTVSPAATTLQGTIAGGAGQSGTFTLTVQTAISTSAFGGHVRPLSVATASGTLTLINAGAASALTGTFDTVTGALDLAGGGFVLTGVVAQGATSGAYTGPDNTSGGFAGLDATSHVVTQLCGRYTGSNTGEGIWNIQISSNGAASGETRPDLSARDPQPRTTLLTGQLSGNVLTLQSVEDGATATGVVDGGTVTGTHDDGQGTFSGSTSACH